MAGGAVSVPSPAPVLPALASAPVPAALDWPSRLASPYAEAAAAVRRHDFPAAQRLLDPLTRSPAPEGARARLVLGLQAQACGRSREAGVWLAAGGESGGVLEDWRLLTLAEALAASGQGALARVELERLLADHPTSLLRARARGRLAELAWQDHDLAAAAAAIEQARRDRVAGPEAFRLETLAWEIGRQAGQPELARTAARWLLVEEPLEASKLGVINGIWPARGTFSWSGFLTAPELVRRATRLYEVELYSGAEQSLDAVPAAEREIDWYVLRARLLTAQHRGSDALRLLQPVAPTAPEATAAVEWERARALAEAATVRRGRQNPSTLDRAKLREAAYQHLRQAAAAAPGSELARRAWRELYLDLAEEDRFDAAMAALAQLRALDPSDTTGARPLWERGWEEYRGRNYTGAIGYWTQLFELYPQNTYARAGRYWSGRAFEALGDAPRATKIYREVAAGRRADFYARQAASRLTGRAAAPPAAPALEPEPWPTDTALARARWLSDLGLDALAAIELDLHPEVASTRAAQALRGVVLGRQEQPRESLRWLRQAFPMLATAFQSRVPRLALELYYPLPYAATVETIAQREGLPPALVFAVIHQESGFDSRAKSRSGARGLMQLMPATGRGLARQLGLPYSLEKLFEPEYSVRLGTRYLRQVLQMFDGREELALASYNGGPGRISGLWRRAGPQPELDAFLEGLTIEESKNYVKRTLVLADGYRSLYPQLAAVD